MRLALATVFLMCSFAEDLTAQVPEVLRRSLELRRSYQTAEMRYRLKLVGPWGDNFRNFESRIAGGSYMVIDRGDDDGIITYSAHSGLPNLGMRGACAPVLELVDRNAGNAWYFQEGSGSATSQTPAEATALDIRTIGFEPFPLISDPSVMIENWKQFFPSPGHWRVKESGHFTQVVAERDFDVKQAPKHRQKWVWTIDPSRDDVVVSIVIEVALQDQAPRTWGKGETTYKLIDGHWIPSAHTGWREGKENEVLRAEYELLEASLDKEHHPRTLTVDMLKIPDGTFVGSPSSGRRGVRVWNGKATVSRDEWIETKRPPVNQSVELTLAGRQKADHYRYPAWWYDETGLNGLEGVPTDPNEWEAYVRRWCIRHEANEKQRTAAKSVLDDCRKEARAYLKKHRLELEKLESRQSKLETSSKESIAVKAEKEKLLRPVSAIFDRLKARLEPLLLQEQAARNTMRSQPTSAATSASQP